MPLFATPVVHVVAHFILALAHFPHCCLHRSGQAGATATGDSVAIAVAPPQMAMEVGDSKSAAAP
jgi:hypothetical protein